MNGHTKTAQQSRTWLLDAYFELLTTHRDETITVTTIAATADLSRRTFYRFFNNKSDLLNYYGQQLLSSYDQYLATLDTKTATFNEIMVLFFNFIWDHRRRLRILIRQNLFMARLPELMAPAIARYQALAVSWHAAQTPAQIQLIMTFALGGYWNVVNDWLMADDPVAPTEIANNLLLILNKLLSTSSPLTDNNQDQ
ncbi:TetR family transcriptional regulator [Lactiplantibacillus fabifermentans]|uniref:HTH tetR-type domain-containing protein n=2 Tax=Lactiplantibacillus fabifermentans TaxID=483011 RepID=A0A0R2NSK8_9LACO|nr:TetR/AcrR family transcriptional regulator [Lactiplantibacillus fabifermentans]ETY73174.1 TetR family transcriptional regulator [Lactiplantibacillus fabifermentans T30PCM01]KRO27858.1 hypothetical protein DY78_GL002851 [Lactiplantibacillus fabifermentans DSM 21115]